jgi:ribosomal protein S18 acetylase RimI-like enzyme
VLIVISKSGSAVSMSRTSLLEGIAELTVAEYGYFGEEDEEVFRTAMSDPTSVVAVEEDRGVVCGFVLMLGIASLPSGERFALVGTGADVTSEDLYIESIVVAKDRRQQGVGRRLLRLALSLVPDHAIWAAVWGGSTNMKPVCDLFTKEGLQIAATASPGYWEEQSRDDEDWVCVVCGSVCRCEAIIAMRPAGTGASLT